MHIVARPNRAPSARIRCSRVVAIRAPLAPRGWPIAIAPPRVLTFSSADPQELQDREHLDGERLVQLDAADVGRASARPAPGPCGPPGPGRSPSRRGRPRPRPSTGSGPSASGPARCAFSSDMISRAAAPTLIGELLPAVTEPPGRVERRRRARRAPRSRCRGGCTGRRRAGPSGPSRRGPRSGRSRRGTGPESVAAAASWWLRRANSSCLCREIRYLAARYSAVRPMFMIASPWRADQAGAGVVVLRHRDVVHVLDPAGDLDVLAARRRCSWPRR